MFVLQRHAQLTQWMLLCTDSFCSIPWLLGVAGFASDESGRVQSSSKSDPVVEA
jgi:hypothetical protein